MTKLCFSGLKEVCHFEPVKNEMKKKKKKKNH